MDFDTTIGNGQETERFPPTEAIWSLIRQTRFGPDFVWIEPSFIIGGDVAVSLVIDETTDPVDGSQRSAILLYRDGLEQLKDGIEHALAWFDRNQP